MEIESLKSGIATIRQGLNTLNGLQVDYVLDVLMTAYNLLLTRYSPVKVGDHVRLTYTPRITWENAPGWMHAKSFMYAGAKATVRKLDVFTDGRLEAWVSFCDDLSEHPGWYAFSVEKLALEAKFPNAPQEFPNSGA